MLLWADEQLAILDAAVEQARAGRPAALTVLGDAGTGKTSLLDELVAKAPDFQVLAADGLENARMPFGLLAQWGVDPPRGLDDGVGDPFVAAQGLRDVIDRSAASRPVLLRLDDLHWADPESIEALTWLLRRASGDRLLVAVGSRPLPAHLHAGWQRWVAGRQRGRTISLTGLSAVETATLVEALRPGTPVEVSERLREHTAGNPLYLTALLNEFDTPELTRMRILPAPAEFAQMLGSRVSRLAPDSGSLLRATAVLGTGWASLLDVAAVADVAEAGPAVTELIEAGLLQMRAPQGAVTVRITHALMRAAVYQQTPLAQRRLMHARAAAAVVDRSAVLEHRMAAAQRYDDELAESMARYAIELYQQHSFRLAAQYLRWSSVLTSDPPRRERRWLESLFYSVMALDVGLVHEEHDQVARAADGALRALVLGGLAVWERRFHDGIALLEPAARALTDDVDRTTRYRIEVLLAWARMCVGYDTRDIAAGLRRAADSRVPDAGLDGSELVTAGGTGVQVDGFRTTLDGDWFAAVPARPEETPLALTKQLIWRGAARARLGFFDDAVRDLTEGTRRIQNGVTDFGRGAFHASLAFAHWMRGDWSRARLTARLALDFSGPFSHPMVLALTALPSVGEGRFDEADDLLTRSQAILERAPWWEACQLLVIGRIARLHAGTSVQDRAGFLAAARGTPFDFGDLRNTSPILKLHLGLAGVWAGDQAYARLCVESMLAEELPAAWIPGAALWLQGLLAAELGADDRAAAHFDSAIAHEADNLPLYHAHLLADCARTARRLGRESVRRQALERAQGIYRRLGAAPYIEEIEHLRAASDPPGGRPGTATFALTEREQDVLTLVAAGMSYAQVSRELFITQSTVGYHLSNIYDKTGIRTRHRLTELFRREPQAFGLAASA